MYVTKQCFAQVQGIVEEENVTDFSHSESLSKKKKRHVVVLSDSSCK